MRRRPALPAAAWERFARGAAGRAARGRAGAAVLVRVLAGAFAVAAVVFGGVAVDAVLRRKRLSRAPSASPVPSASQVTSPSPSASQAQRRATHPGPPRLPGADDGRARACELACAPVWAASASWRSSRRICLRSPRGIFAAVLRRRHLARGRNGGRLTRHRGLALGLAGIVGAPFRHLKPLLTSRRGRISYDSARSADRRSISPPHRASIIQPSAARRSGGSSQRRMPRPGPAGRRRSMRTRAALRSGSSETPTSSAAMELKSGS